MELYIALIRHGRTAGGDAKFIGMTDEPLSEQGEREIRAKCDAGAYPQASLVFSSGLARCVDTARIIYPAAPTVVLRELRAPDYGDFEGMTYADLVHDERFERWVSFTGAKACPSGEEPYVMLARSAAAFRKICDEIASKGLEQVAVVSHRMVFLAILQRFYVPRSKYVNWDILYGCGYLLQYDTTTAAVKIIEQF